MRAATWTRAGVAALALLTGCGTESGPTGESAPSLAAASHPNTTEHNRFVTQLDEVFSSPCNGELIHYTGTLVTDMHFVFSPDMLDPVPDTLHSVLHMMVRETGIGLTTGTVYTAKDNFYEGFTLPDGHDQYQSFSFHEKFRITADAPGLSFGGHLQVHFVGVPDGDGKFTKVVEGEECFTRTKETT
jgi:hypothetical protein